MNHKTQLLKKAMQSWWIRAERDRFQLGILGRTNSDGTVTVAADQQDFVWVTLDIGTLVQAYNVGNGAVDNRAGLPVRVRQDNGRLLIDGINTAGFAAGDSNAPGSVYSVNDVGPDSHGNVALDPDDLDDTSTTHKFTTAADISKLAGIEALADVTDAGNVGAAVNSATTDNTLDDTDVVPYATGSTLKKTAWSVIKSTLKTYFDTLYNLYVHPNHSGDVTSVGDGATTIGNDKVTFAKMQNIATDSLIGRDTASSGDPENILLNTTLSMDDSGNLQRAALSGDVSAGAGSNTTAIGNDKVLTAMILDAQVTLAKMANLAQSTIIGRAAGAGTGVPTALSVAQVVAIINATLDHGGLAGLSDDDHAQYLALAGRAGSQVQNGGTAANEDLTLRGTAHATKTTSYVLIQDTGGNVGIGGATAPTHKVDIGAAATDLHSAGTTLGVNNTAGAEVSVATASSSAVRSGITLIRSRGDFTTPTAVVDADSLGFIGFKAHDGTNVLLPALIEAFADGSPSTGLTPARISLITGSSSGTRAARLTVDHNGAVTVAQTLGVTGLLTASAGINLGDTTLQNYKESTWTPVLKFGGGTTGIAYTQQLGTYTRIGDVVFWTLSIILSNKGSSTGNATITGLPLTPSASATAGSVLWISMTSTLSNVTFIADTTPQIAIYGATGSVASLSALNNTAFANATQLSASGFYYV